MEESFGVHYKIPTFEKPTEKARKSNFTLVSFFYVQTAYGLTIFKYLHCFYDVS